MCYSDALSKENIKVDIARPYLLEQQNSIEYVDINNKDMLKNTLNEFINCVNKRDNLNFKGTVKSSGFCKSCPYKKICNKAK